MHDTIYAPSTAIGGAIAVIRVSGPDAAKTVQLFDRDITNYPQKLCHVRVSYRNELLDDAMAVWFAAPKTYTGENLIEINCHGGSQTVQRILAALAGLGFRPATGGEFTKRAFLNGKMDLSQAEAVMDIITATAEQSRKAALLQLDGSISRKIGAAQNELLNALSGIDAALDYPDEAEDAAYAALPTQLVTAQTQIRMLIAEGRAGRVLRDGVRVALLGRPNVGKSSLLNALCGVDRAIVTPIAGTTRDIVDEKLSIGGVPVRLIDTAGIRESCDTVEQIGVQRAKQAMETADVCIVVLDGALPLTDDDRAVIQLAASQKTILVKNKSDLPNAWESQSLSAASVQPISVSAKNGEGLDTLKQTVLRHVLPETADCNCITNERHIHALEQADNALTEALIAEELDCIATDIATALHALGEITGEDVDETVIDRIFSRFCVGK